MKIGNLKDYITELCFMKLIFLLFTIVFWHGQAQRIIHAEENTQVVVQVKSQAWVKGEKITVGNVADIKGKVEGMQEVDSAYLGLSPQPGRIKNMPGSWVESKIRSFIKFPENTIFETPDYVRIERNCQHLDEKHLEKQFVVFVAKKLKSENADFEVRRFRVTGNAPLPEGEINIELEQQGKSNWMGNVSMNAAVKVNGEFERTLVLSGWIDRFEDVVCVRRRLSRNDKITKQDIGLERKNVSQLSGNVIRNIDFAAGKRIKNSVQAGDVLLERQIEKMPVIDKGNRVTILAESPALKISTLGIAQAKGCVGDIIRVTNCISNKDVYAAVVDSKTVRVSF